MRIALVDDDPVFLSQTARMLKVLLENRGTVAVVKKFDSAEMLIAAQARGCQFDMYFLDVMMPGMNGIELGRMIRRSQPEAPLLFFTTSRDFAVEAIGIEAVSYVIKPFDEASFSEAIERALKRLVTVKPLMLMLKTADGLVNLPKRNFVNAETNGHYTTVYDSSGRAIVTRMSIQDLCERLEGDSRFVRVSRQMLVNIAHVTAFTEGTLRLSTGQKISVARRSLGEVRSRFIGYYDT